jgi:hypothetical protein
MRHEPANRRRAALGDRGRCLVIRSDVGIAGCGDQLARGWRAFDQ